MTEKFADFMQAGSQLSVEKKLKLTLVQGLIHELAQLLEAQKQASASVLCEIAKVAGDTSVRSVVIPEGIASLQKDDPAIIRIRLREQDVRHKRLCSSDSGSFAWRFKPVTQEYDGVTSESS